MVSQLRGACTNPLTLASVHLSLGSCVVRDWAAGDVHSLVRHANNRNVWINLRDRFPHPYTETTARQFLAHVSQQDPTTVWAIEVDGEAAGGIGLVILSDIERVSAEIGYWLGEAFWGRGVTTEALRAVTAEAFRRFDLRRIFALPFADNTASIRVLEKVGYTLEGQMPDSAIKDGVVRDQRMYGAYKKHWGGQRHLASEGG
jgi:ribosomal-protein-alanine N-acetyltransferase